MKQKITISIPVNADKCRAKAMQTAVSTTGDENLLVVAQEDKVAVCRGMTRKTEHRTSDVGSWGELDYYRSSKGQLVVIGEGIDSFELMKCLKKKFKCASILSIEEVKPQQKQPDKQKDGEKKEEKKDEKKKDECCKACPCPCPPGYNNPCVQYYPVCQPVYDPYPQTCSIL